MLRTIRLPHQQRGSGGEKLRVHLPVKSRCQGGILISAPSHPPQARPHTSHRAKSGARTSKATKTPARRSADAMLKTMPSGMGRRTLFPLRRWSRSGDRAIFAFLAAGRTTDYRRRIDVQHHQENSIRGRPNDDEEEGQAHKPITSALLVRSHGPPRFYFFPVSAV